MPSTEVSGDRIDTELSGLDALELPVARKKSFAAKAWAATWPKVLAVAIFFFLWQLIVWSGWKPEYVLPPPSAVFDTLFSEFDDIIDALGTTMERAVQGFALAILIGTIIGALVSRNRILRAGVGSMITGLQTMPSIAWFPLAILVFKATNGAILFVVVLGAAPSIANGLISGIDHIPPLYLRAGKVLGARGFASYRHVIMPAALPSFVAGLKQGWAFAWRSLLAGELLVLIPGTFSLGYRLELERGLNDSDGVIAVMMVIFVIGVVVDALFFGTIERRIRRRYGLVDEGLAA